MTPAPIALVDEDAIDRIEALLALRKPNKEALDSIAHRLAGAQGEEFEGVVDVATGVGKTYILGAAIEYLAETAGVRHFMVITPGETILRKTIANFTPGGRKSLTDAMTVRVHVITAENYNTPNVRRVLDDPDEVKLFVFTVQSLLRPTNEQRRRVRTFQEGLGEELYEYLQNAHDLVVFADEHHCYYGVKFSDAVRDLHPFALIGLTATPHSSTPEEQIIYRYPLAHAIADKLVKTPVIVGRTDDRKDVETKLQDGVTLLRAKDTALAKHCRAEGLRRVNPIMLVVAPTIDEAKEVEDLLGSTEFFDGAYADAVLRIDSSSPDQALAELEKVEDPQSKVRIIVSVGMLKEGWDVANVYVIVSLRASVSEILTEQTLGRGLRLPFGKYTDVELLDTLEVVAHEKYEDLLKRSKVLKEKLIDWRTYYEAHVHVDVVDPLPEGPPPTAARTGEAPTTDEARELELVAEEESETPVLTTDVITTTTVEQRAKQAEDEAQKVAELSPNPAHLPVQIPIVDAVLQPPQLSLLDIHEMEPFRSYGRRLALNPSDELLRSVITATLRTGPSGIPEVDLSARPAEERIYSQGILIEPEEARRELMRRLLAAPQVPPAANQIAAAEPIVDAFLAGLGAGIEHLGAWLDQAAGGLVALVQKEMVKAAAPVQMSETVRLTAYAKLRTGRPRTSDDLQGQFTKGVGYTGFKKSLYREDWFDSRPERDLANILDRSDDVSFWLRLQRGDLTILWRGQDSWYNPDFLVTGIDAGHWIVEVKADKDMETTDVQAKRDAALRWARRVNAAGTAGKWRYLLVSESQLKAATGDWRRLKALYSGE